MPGRARRVRYKSRRRENAKRWTSCRASTFAARIEVRQFAQPLIQRLLFLRQCRGRNDLQYAIQVARAAARLGQALAAEAQFLSAACARAYPYACTAFQRRDFHFRAQRRFPGRDRHFDIKVVTRGLEHRMRTQLDVQVEVPGRTAADARSALAAHAQALAVHRALGHAYARALRRGRLAEAHGRRGQVELQFGALRGLFQADDGGRLHILPGHGETAAAGMAAAAAAAVTTEAREQIAQIEVLEAARTEARFPVLRGLEVLTRPVATQLVVGGPFLRIGKGLIGLRNFLESLFRVR